MDHECHFCKSHVQHRCRNSEEANKCGNFNPEVRWQLMSQWSQGEITAWANHTFGDNPALEIAIRLNVEMAELLTALMNGDIEGAQEECADVEIMLRQVAQKLNMNLNHRVNGKMVINVRRKWSKQKNGKMQHD